MKRSLKALLFICIIISSATASTAVAFAAVVTTNGTPIEGYKVYHDVEGWGVLNNAEMTYFTIEGRTAFCIEAGGAIRGVERNYQAGIKNNIDVDYVISAVTKDNSVQSMIAYLGYCSLEKPTLKDYVFTQMMIWQSLPEWYANGINSATGGYRSYFTDRDVRAEYEEWKRKIEKKVNTWKTTPAFDVSHNAINEITPGQSITLSDSNGVLEDFNSFAYTQEGVTVEHTAGSNVLKVTASKNCTKSRVSMGADDLSDAGAVKYDSRAAVNYVYASDNSQDMGVYGNTVSVPFALSFKVKNSGNLKIIKESEGKLICGITLNVEKTDGTYQTTVKTGTDGTVTLKDIPTGEYKVGEVTPIGYVKHDIVTVIVEPEETATAYLKNQLQKGRIVINKRGRVFWGSTQNREGMYFPLYAEDNLAGAVYEVIAAEDFEAADGTILQEKGTVADIVTTDADGKAATKELYLGKYILKEKQPPSGYVMDPWEHEVTLTYGGEETTVITEALTVRDRRQRAKIFLFKTMELDPYGQLKEDMADNAVFGLYAGEDIYTADKASCIPCHALVGVMEVDCTGKASYEGQLPEGSYYVKEISTDSHYTLSWEKYPVEIRYNATGEEYINILINDGEEIKNQYISCSLRIIKRDEQSGVPIGGTGFKLFNGKDEEVAEGYTDEEGCLEFKGLPLGTYTVKEFQASSGYVMDEEEKYVIFTQDYTEVSLDIFNRAKTGDIRKFTVAVGQDAQGVPKTEDKNKILMWTILAVISLMCLRSGFIIIKNQ